jgi:hypothetical protein
MFLSVFVVVGVVVIVAVDDGIRFEVFNVRVVNIDRSSELEKPGKRWDLAWLYMVIGEPQSPGRGVARISTRSLLVPICFVIGYPSTK